MLFRSLLNRLQKLLIRSNSSYFVAMKFLLNSSLRKDFSLSDVEKYLFVKSSQDILRGAFYPNKYQFDISCRNLDSVKWMLIQYVLRLALEPTYYDKSNWILTLSKKNKKKKI